MIPIWTRTPDRHIADGHAFFHGQTISCFSPILYGIAKSTKQHRSALSKLGCNPLNRSLLWGSTVNSTKFSWATTWQNGLGSKTCSPSWFQSQNRNAPKGSVGLQYGCLHNNKFPRLGPTGFRAHHEQIPCLAEPWAAWSIPKSTILS